MPSPSLWTFTSQDILAAGVSWANASADAPTCIVVQGSRPELPDGGNSGAIVTSKTELEIIEPYAVKGASFVTKDFEEGLLALGNPGPKPVEPVVVQRIETIITKKDGCLQRTQVDTYEQFRAEAARYSQKSFGGRQQREGVFVDADGTVGGTERAYADRYESLQLVRRIVTVPIYSGADDELTAIKVQSGLWFNPPAALFFDRQIPSGEFDRLNVFTLGSGAGVKLSEQEFFGGSRDPIIDNDRVGTTPNVDVWYQVETSEVDSEGGYEIGREESQVTFELTLTGGYVYDEGDQRRSFFPEARALVLAARSTIRSAIRGEEGSHIRVEVETDRDFLSRITTETLRQYLPAVEACSLELELRKSSAQFAAIVCAGESTRRDVILIIDSPWVETIDQAAALGILELRELQAVEISLPIPPAPFLEAGAHVTVDVPTRGYTSTSAWIESIGHNQAERAEGEATPRILGRVVLKTSAF